jgi:VIT1/CCC1 family predicted Fe2+/Mn2+ transporter
MHALANFLILLTAGFTASGIAANLYRISGFEPETTLGHFLRVVVLMFAGPSEMFESAIDARISGRWSAMGFWLAIAGICHWSLIVGLAVTHGASSIFAA